MMVGSVVSYIQMPEGLSPTHQSARQYNHSSKGMAISIRNNNSITIRQRTQRYNDKFRLEHLLHLDQVRHGVN